MSTVLAAVTETPAYLQIIVQDMAQQSEPPMWETEDDPLVQTPECFMIATIDDMDGNVRVEFRAGSTDIPDVREIYNGIFTCSSGEVSVSAPAMNREKVLSLPHAGDWNIRIAVKGLPRPDYIAIFFDEDQWNAATGRGQS
jgi:hypothetical protein